MNDISTFDFDAMWDLSLAVPKLVITNRSVGGNLAACTFWFVATSGGGFEFHKGTEQAPDKTGVWATFEVPESIPLRDGHVEWSGDLFTVTGYVLNSTEQQANLTKNIRICRPAGNKVNTSNNYGTANISVDIKCERARVAVQDLSNYTYNGSLGVQESKQIKLFYPSDGTGVPPTPVSFNNVNNGLFIINQNGEGYAVALEAVYRYSFDGGSSVRIKYRAKKVFAVRCNVDLCPLACEISKLEQEYQTNGCSAAEREKMILINSKLSRAIIAKMQPLCNENVEQLVEEIKVLGNFQCSCEGSEGNGLNDAAGLNPQTTPECATVIECINQEFNQAVFHCLVANQGVWEGMSLRAKITQMALRICEALDIGNAENTCAAPGELTIDVNAETVTFTWPSPLVPPQRYKWTIYLRIDADNFQVYKSGYALDLTFTIPVPPAGTYNFEIQSECGDTLLSNITRDTFVIPA